MTAMSSATQTSMSIGLLRLPPPNIAANPHQMEQWYYQLTPSERGRFAAYITELIRRQPAEQQRRISERYTKINASAIGLGFWGAIASVASAAVQAGTSIYTNKQSADLQKALSGQRLSTEAQIAAMTNKVQADLAQAKLEAEKEAARIAGTAQIKTAEAAAGASVAKAGIAATAATPAIIGVVAIGGIATWFLLKKKRR